MSGTARAWVFFTDKGIANEQAYLDAVAQAASAYNARAIERRKLRRTAPGLFDEYDLPVVQAYAEAVLRTGARRRIVSDWLNAISVEATAKQLHEIAAFPFVLSIERVRQAERTPLHPVDESPNPDNDPHSMGGFYGRAEAQIVQISLAALHDKGFTGDGVIVGVLDTGFRQSHQAFNEPGHELDVIAQWDFMNDDPNTDRDPGDNPDQHNHGTWILGSVGAYKPGQLIGGAYDASFILTKVEEFPGPEYPLEEDWFTAGLEFIEANGGDVATSSVGAQWYEPNQMDGQTSVMARAWNIATANGVHGCQAAGNFGHDNNPETNHLLTPADAFDVISCGAVDLNGAIADFSSDGPTTDGRTKPEVLARGVNTWTVSSSSDTGYSQLSGTSLSTPLVASAVACLVQAHPQWTVEQMRQRLFTTADYYLANRTHDPLHILGHGIIDAAAADQAGIRILHGHPDWDRNDPNTWISFNDWAYGGYIDPKVESTDGENLDLGLNTFNVVFSTAPFGNPAGGPVTRFNISTEQTGGPPPNVAAVATSGNTLTVELDRNITPQEWTTLIFNIWNADGLPIEDHGNEGQGINEAARLDVGFLPGNVNNDNATQPLDLNRWLTSWNGGNPIFPSDVENGHPDDYLDISRGGGTQPVDFTRIIASLKGQFPFTQNWRNVSMNAPRP